jgi:predicted PurR-regulated permease PerM
VKAVHGQHQFGAILAVGGAVLAAVFSFLRVLQALLIAFLPAAVIGFALSEVIDRLWRACRSRGLSRW